MTDVSVTHRFLVLVGLRWFATGLLIPVAALLPLERGLSLGELGTAMAAQGVVVLLLEIPSGALNDAWGRRPVFVMSGIVAIVAYTLTLTAGSVLAFALAWAVTGVFRALDSGALESWFVDAENARGAAREVPSGLAAAGGVISAAIAAGSLVTAGLVAWAPWSNATALAVPYVLAIGVVVVQVVTAVVVMERPARRTATHDATPESPGRLWRLWRRTMRDGIALARGPHLRGLALAMVLIAVGVAALELFMPVRLAELTGDNAAAAARLGLVSAVAWGLAAAGSAVTSRLLRRVGPRWVAVGLVAVQALGLLTMALASVPTVLVAGFWIGYLVHSAHGATYNALVHARVDDAQRGTALSITSMAFLGSAAAGGAGLGLLAEHASSAVAVAVGAGALLLAAGALAATTRQAGQPN